MLNIDNDILLQLYAISTNGFNWDKIVKEIGK